MTVKSQAVDFVWPEQRPAEPPFRWSLDGGGRELITGLISQHGWKTMIEVGVYCGGSALQWLDACPDLFLYGVDPYPADAAPGTYFAKHRTTSLVTLTNETEDQFIARMSKPDCLYPAIIANMWDYRDRFVPIRGFSPQALIDLAGAGVVPDLIYLDAMKTGEEMSVIRDLWPSCIITGDDWTWTNNDGVNPLHAVVHDFAAANAMDLIVRYATWVLSPKDAPVL